MVHDCPWNHDESLPPKLTQTKKNGGGPGHDGGELLEADDAVTVGVCLPHHLRQLAVRQGMAHLGHRPGQLSRRDVAVAVAVKQPEHLRQLLLVDKDLLGHVGQQGTDQLVKLDRAVAIGVHVGEHGVDLVAGRLEAKGAEEGGELELREAAIGVHVEAREDVPKLLQLLGLEGGRSSGH